jgi:hypothetical protein
MKYTVTYTPLAEFQLTDIWLRATHRQDVTDASRDIDRALAQNAEQTGEPDENGWRILAVPPLVVTFKVSEPDRTVTMLSVRYRP